ncbi:MFS transporter [Mesorhizobium sp. B2-4-17]|uniref:MFS transporter n=1 Tax=Mesorhizobium sp. B2-4-17 TaxID=2589932 RepID=UPI001128386E|nr:MFS transporter [Mesorhizobium sp. B2-4-17]TPK78139.1 MFS transporter [Mesorhizobium sp. B2-4-17]
MTFGASGSAPTPLYEHYRESLGLGPLHITVIFAAYVICLLGALLTVGSLSDYIGRRPAITAALLLNIVAMVLFMTANSVFALVAARSVQGFATGFATTTLGAAILDTASKRGIVLNSITAFTGLTIGSLGAAILVTYAPYPQQLVYGVLMVLSAIEAVILFHMPETAPPRPGAIRSLLPHVRVPREARGALAQVAPAIVASWALGGFYFSLMPSLVRIATGATQPIVGGFVVAALTFSGVLTVLAVGPVPPSRVLGGGIIALAAGIAITLGGVHAQLASIMLFGTLIAGTGFGATFAGALRTLLPLAAIDERAGLLSVFYIVGYLSFALPAILAGYFSVSIGLVKVAEIYGIIVIVLAFASLLATLLFGARRKPV